MSINYASKSIIQKELRKASRRQSLNSNLMQYHKFSQNKTFTESFPVSLHQSKSTFKNQLSQLELYKTKQISDNPMLDYKSHPFTFEDKTKSKTEATKKKFIFDDQPKKKENLKNLMSAVDEYIDFLNESSECFTTNSEAYNKLENVLLHKFNVIKQKHEELKQKCKTIQHSYKAEKYQNQLQRQQLIDLQCQLDDEKRKSQINQLHHQKLKQQHQDLLVRLQYLQNSYLREKLKNENQKLRNIQQSISIYESDTSQYQQEESSRTSETIDDLNVRKFLKSQMRKLKQNNQQIDNYSRLYKKYSEHNQEDF